MPQVTTPNLKSALIIGENHLIEFKENFTKLDREMVAFANGSGGVIYCGVSDNGKIRGVSADNKSLSTVQDLARNCDPPIEIIIHRLEDNVVAIEIPEGADKPYQCSSGFFLRTGPSTQKLRAPEIRALLTRHQRFFDSRVHSSALVEKNLSHSAYINFCQKSGIVGNHQPELLLTNLSAAQPDKNGVLHFTNTGLLLFTDEPKKFLAESSITAVCYRGKDRFSVVDRIDITGDLISQIEEAVSFVRRHTSVEYEISTQAKRVERYDYPLVAIREAIINALIHRDYAYQNSCTYLNLFSDRLEIENPGGLLPPLTIANLESHSVRRNPLLADLLYRAGYGEKLGSGLLRISQALQENGNPSYVISATNFFSIQFMPRAKSVGKTEQPRNPQQLEILVLLEQAGRELSAKQIADQLKVSSTTVTRRLKLLLAEGLVRRIGVGKGMRYTV